MKAENRENLFERTYTSFVISISGAIIIVVIALVVMVVIVNLASKVMAAEEKVKPFIHHLGSGTMYSDDKERPVIEVSRTEPFILDGYINLQNMKKGDRIIIRQYVKLKPDGNYILYDYEEYADEQEKPLIYITPKTAVYGILVTLQQIEGTPILYDWEFHMISS